MSSYDQETNDVIKFLTAQLRYERDLRKGDQRLIDELDAACDKHEEEIRRLKDEIRTIRYNHRI